MFKLICFSSFLTLNFKSCSILSDFQSAFQKVIKRLFKIGNANQMIDEFRKLLMCLSSTENPHNFTLISVLSKEKKTLNRP